MTRGRPGRSRRTARAVLSWLLLAIAAVALWPASWGGTLGLTIVSGHSMEPTYYTGDLVLTVRQPDYAVGDVVSAVVPEGELGAGGRVIHRILSIRDGVIATRGDNNADLDPWVLAKGDVTGRAILHLPAVGLLWSSQVLPWLIAIVAGLAVTMLLWPSKVEPAAEPDPTGPDPADTTGN
ncbi:MAG: S24/S26 family peptidase [Propionicimonas sp.]